MAAQNDPELPGGGRNRVYTAPPGGVIVSAVKNNKAKVLAVVVVVIALGLFFTQG